jgi:hypothetical protein
MDRHQYGIKDPYQEKIDSLKRHNPNEMSDLVLPDSITDSGSSGTMDEI